MKIFKKYAFLAFLLIFAFACRKESLDTTIDTQFPEPAIFIESTVFGIVKDANGIAIEDADVFWGSAFTSTDQNGYFTLKSIVPEKIAVLNVKKENYFDAYQTLSAIKEKSILTNIQLIERQLSGSLTANSGGTINISGGGKVEFEANSFVDESGNPYNGTVNIYTTYLDPTIPNLQAQMPGNLMAINLENEQRLLKSFGMVNVELENNAGEKLQLSQPATLNVPVPASLTDQSPATIPLWHFDTENGLWIEEGEASLQGNEYIGEVSHFSWWNCDIPQDFIFLQGDIDIEGREFPILELRFTVISDGSVGITTTSNTGIFEGFVPKNEALLLEILDPCGEMVYSEEIGPFGMDTQLPVITLSLSGIELVSVTGNAFNCNSEPVTNGYAIVLIPSTTSFGLFPIENGNFNGSIIDCGGAQYVATVFDYAFQTQSSPHSLPGNTTDVDFGDLYACELAFENAFSITINGTTENYSPCTTTITYTTVTQTFHIAFQIVQPNGTVDYEVTISTYIDGYSFQYEITETGTPDFVYHFEGVDAPYENVIRITEFENAGQISRFLINNVTINEVFSNGTVVEHTSCTLDIKALIN